METESFDNSVYPVNCGKAIVFQLCSEGPESDPSTLKGNEKDAEDLKLILQKFNFDVIIEKDKTKKEIKERLEAVSKEDHDKIDAILVAVLTHGNEEGLKAKDVLYDPQEILFQPFKNEALAEKPKIFLIAACRGSQVNLIFL